MYSNRKAFSPPRKAVHDKSPRKIIIDIPNAPEEISHISPRSTKYRKSPGNVASSRSANPSPQNLSKKMIRMDSSKRKLRRSPRPLGSRPPRVTRRVRPTPETGNTPQLSDIVTKVKVSSSKKQRMSPEEIEARSEVFYKEHLFATFQALKFVRNMSPIDTKQLLQKRLCLSRRPGYEDKKLAVFDLDETLVHCVDDIDTCNPDFVVPIKFPTGEVIDAGINLRPYAVECLVEANKDFEVAVFTASHQCYADVVLDYIDPDRKLIHHRLYRDNCIYNDGIYIKDLRVFGNRDLKDIVIIDNAAYSFGYQLDNGIPIISWHDDYHDKEMFNLIDYLKLLAQTEDIREINRETFHMRTFYEDYMQEVFGAETDAIVRSKSPEIMNNLANRNKNA